ncbi:hypothetical protein M422DRAFT_778606 [Sphaerobolus stellatus SS14]|uniref:Protein kinase domain-containing protein n=1 Tax=Sphaerobolus stellatus (strain SS14) TaxID=990650 RepID=A0A0C9W316_SPHS4|nr:hypothetical protein M422DRAFT_778606 [Sphaerobolus stellatus SS14]
MLRELDSDKRTARFVAFVRSCFEGYWLPHDDFFQNLFPIKRSTTSTLRQVREGFYNDQLRYKRWKTIPKSPKSVDTLYTPLTNLMNNIIAEFGVPREARRFINTHSTQIEGADDLPFSPGIFLSGGGPEFNRTAASLPCPRYRNAISPIEVCLDTDDQIYARDRLAVFMQEIFVTQGSRRFAYGLVITPNVLTMYMFDHSGIAVSPPLDYHKHPEQFAIIISGMAANPQRIGFDSSVWGDDTGALVRSTVSPPGSRKKYQKYRIEDEIFQFPFMPGRGTLVWLVSLENSTENIQYVIKDAWIAHTGVDGHESEGTLLALAKERGVNKGLAQIEHFEEVQQRNGIATPDTTLRNRRMGRITDEQLLWDRIHTRIILKGHGKTIDNFDNRLELLYAFRDAVVAHRHLHNDAGILHRDISINNILINSNGEEGNRGLLIDLDHAIRVDNDSPYSKIPLIGTWRFMSYNVLDKRPPTFLDDLQSFYYVLLWVVYSHSAPHRRQRVPRRLQLWDSEYAPDSKRSFIMSHLEDPIPAYFGQAFPKLLKALGKFFIERFQGEYGIPPPDLHNDYDVFIKHINTAISELELEPEVETLPPCLTHEKPLAGGDEPDHSLVQEETQHQRKRRRRSFWITNAERRPKRSTAKY